MMHRLRALIALPLLGSAFAAAAAPARSSAERVAAVTGTPGCVAFWDFVQREPAGARRFTAHVPPAR